VNELIDGNPKRNEKGAICCRNLGNAFLAFLEANQNFFTGGDKG